LGGGGRPPFETISHPKPPSVALWNGGDFSSTSPPVPTNHWWANLVVDDGDQLIAPSPYLIKCLVNGLHVSMPNKVIFVVTKFSVNEH